MDIFKEIKTTISVIVSTSYYYRFYGLNKLFVEIIVNCKAPTSSQQILLNESSEFRRMRNCILFY